MTYSVNLPNGDVVNFPDSVPKEEAARIIRQQLGMEMPGAQKRTGFGAALATGFEGFLDPTITAGQAAIGDANKAAEEALKRAANSPYASQVSWDKVKEKFNTEGVLAAAAEVARQAPLALTEQVPQLAATLGGAYAGAKAGALTAPVTGPVGPIAGGVLGAAAATAPAIFGSNIIRQAAEQQERGEAVDVNVPAAAGTAALQTGLETAATFIPLGRRVVRGVFGPQVDALFKQGKTEAAEALAREALARESLAKTLGKGVALGVAVEAPTEVVQSALERWQAGLPLLDEDALKEYGESAYAGALVGGPIGAAGRAYGRSGARAEAREQEEAAAAEQRRAAARVEQEQREAPDYILTLNDEYQKLLTQKNALESQLKKGTKEAPLTQEDKDNNELINRQLKEIKTPLERARQEFLGAGGNPALKKAREKTLDLTPPEGRVSEPVREEEPEEEKVARSRVEAPRLALLLQQQREEMKAAASPEEAAQIAQRVARTKKAAEEAEKTAKTLPEEKELRDRAKTLEKRYAKALDSGDQDVVLEVVPELLQVRQQLLALSPDTGLFAPEAIAAEQQRQAELLDEISAGREAARAEREAAVAAEAQTRQRVEREREALERIRAGEEPLREAVGEAREAQRLEGTYGTLRQEQQFEMFPERVQRIERTAETAKEEVPTPREGARAQVVERPAADVVALRRQLAEQYRELRKLTRAQREAGAAPTGAEGPYSQLEPLPETAQRIEGTKQRIEALEQQLNARMQPAVTTTTVGAPAEGPQVSMRPKGPLDERIRAMAQRIQSSAQVDEDTKTLVAEVADNLPGYLRQAERTAPDAARRTAEWMYRALTGRPDAQALTEARGVLRDIEEGRRSETERLPSGEERRAVQQEFPEMPEPRATAFGSYAEFYNYLVTQAPILVGKDGEAALSVVRMQAELEPLKAQIEGLNAKETALNTEIAALEGQVGAARAAAQRRVELARADLAAARNELESDFEQVLALRDLAQQRYAQALDAATESARALGDHTRALMAAMEAEKTEEVPAVGGTGKAVVFKGGAQRRAALRAAREKVEAALDEWMKAETYKRDVVQRNIGKDWSETSTTFAEYSLAKRQLDAARKKLQGAKNALNNVSTQAKVFSPLSDADLQNYLDREAELYNAFEAQMRRLSRQSGALQKAAQQTNLEKFIQQREAAHQALLKALDRPGTDITAALKGYRASIDAAATRTKDELKLYGGTQAQFDAFDRAQENYAAAQESLAQFADSVQGTREQVTKLQKAAQELRTGAAALRKELRTKQSLIEARKTPPAPPPTTERADRAERERASAEAAQAEQARMERMEALPREVITFDRAKELVASSHPEYERLTGVMYDTSLPLEERAAAAKAADEFLAERETKLDATQKENLRKALTHVNGVTAAQKEVEGLRQKLEGVKLTVAQQRKLKNDPAAAAAALEERKAKVRAALANAEERLTGHRRKLAAVLGFNKPTRVDPAQLRKDREALFSGVLEKRGVRALERGERLGPRAIGPVTRPEVFAPREMRTGSEESRAGETTTQPDTRLKEALGVRQRDVPMTRKEQAEANMIAAENAVEAAKTPSEKRLAEAQLAVAEIRYEIATKGDNEPRAFRLAEAQTELAALTLSKVKLSEAAPLTAREEAVVAKELAGEPEVKGKRKPEQNVDSFLKSLKRITKASKKEKGLRAFGDVDVDVKKGVFDAPGKSAYISLIRNNGVKGKGAASTVLKKLMALADKHGVTLTLQPQKVGAKGLSTEQLEAWYAKSGFKSWDGGMYRKPKNIQDKVGEAPAYEAPEIEILGGPREDVFFSRGETAAPSTTATVRAELGKVFPDLGRVQIYDSVDALVQANPQYKGRIPADARGFVDSAGNKAFLIAENIDQGRALGVLLHEVGSHIGLKNTLGEAQYNALVKAVQTWAKKTDGSPEAKVAQAALARVEAAQTPASQRADETLAYAIEEAVNAGVKPMETKSVLGQWLSRVAQLFRRALEKFGLPPKALDAQGLVDMAFGAAKMEMRGMRPEGTAPKRGELLFSRKTDYAPGLAAAGKVSEQLVGGQRSFVDKVKANLLGFRAQVVDKLAPLEKVAYANMDDMKASQLMFYMRMYDQRNHFTSESLATGVPERKEITRADGRREFVIESKPGANIKQIVDRLSTKAVVKAAGNVDAANRLFTLYTAAKRADRVGYQKLGFGRAAAEAELRQIDIDLRAPTLDPNDRKRLLQRKDYLEKNAAQMPSEADIRAAVKEIEADKTLRDAFEDAREMYNEYNRNLLNFAVQAGTISDAEAKRLLAAKDYVPYYRVRGGDAELVIGGENPIRIGNLKDNPQLEELVGGEEPIFDFLTSSVQNTSMLLDMSLRNLAVKNAMHELRDVGLAKVYSVRNEKGKRRSVPDNAVKFRVKGEDWFAIVNTDAAGVPSDLLVKGLAGIPTMLPAVVRMMAVPARILRRAIVASPVYVARQVVRDSVSAALASGANMTPILSSLRKIGKKGALDARGVTGGQVFTGMPEDMARLLREMQTGRPGWAKAWSQMERVAMGADATTRRAQYDSYREQGLSEMEATLAALESMNFSRRGLSPSVHFANAIIPFFNAQIQGLDVLYRSLRGQMPFDKRLDIRNKLLTRGALLAGMSLAYAASMQDEEEYKNARPDEKYGNWFLRMPFLDEYADEPVVVRVPIPFELGYIFKSLPEALVNTMASEEGGKEALQALKQIAINTIPGGSSMPQLGGVPVPVPLPAAVKPLIEVSLGRSFFTGRDIESVQEQQLEPGARSRDSTSEVAKAVGETFNISPVKMEYLIRGYTGSLGVALMQSLNFLAPAPEGSEKALKRMSELPVVGTVFQPMDAGGIIDATYARVNEIRQAQATYEDLLTKGRTADAQAYLERKADELALASVAGDFRKRMGDVTKAERAIREAPSLSAQEKRERLNELRQVKIQIASAARVIFDRKTPQAAPA